MAELACKWPNDVLVGGHKIAGILLESEIGEGENLAFLVVGVGVNLVSAPPDAEYPATSVVGAGLCAAHARGDARSSRPAFRRLGAALAGGGIWSRCARPGGHAPRHFGEPIRVRLETATLHGRFIDIDQQGALLLETEGGLQRISAGDVFPAR